VGLLLLPTVASAAILASPLTGDGLHVRLWALVLLGIADGQMAAAACLRQTAEAIPVSRFQAATLDCINPWQRIRHVILPASVPALPLLATLTFVGTWSEFLLVAALRRTPGRFALGAATGPENFVTAEYVFASLPLIFLGLWTLRACGRALTASFARNTAVP
jgi:ABC-type glycerol-3-phosphate transport system permease component